MEKARTLLFPTRLLTSEDEYKWYWHQMIYFPETINTISTTFTPSPIHSLVFLELCTSTYSVHAGIMKPCGGRHPWSLVVFLRLLTSSLLPCLGSTDAPCSRLGDPSTPSPIWLPHSPGPRTLPYRDPKQLLKIK